MKFRNSIQIILATSILSLSSCNYLDVTPDNLPTIDNAFTRRSEAIKFLATCYSYLPNDGEPTQNVAYMGGDELWYDFPAVSINTTNWNVARGTQQVTDPYVNYWDGGFGAKNMFQAIRDCNIFLENVADENKVRDLSIDERTRWLGEVEFLKAYYHFVLLRHYGPIPISDESLPVTAPIEEMQQKRVPVDEAFDFIVGLLDSAIDKLPPTVASPVTDLGRITKLIAMGIKAKVLLYAASPLFNGNSDYDTFTDKEGNALFNPVYDNSKWTKAAEAAKEAIDMAHQYGVKLYEFPGTTFPISETTKTQMSIRNAVTEAWNSEIIWGNPNSRTWQLQYSSMAQIDPNNAGNNSVHGTMAPTIKIVEQFYTKNGVPIYDDKTLDFSNIAQLRTATHDERFNLIEGYQTARLHFDREDRFYASVGFDGGIWFMENTPSLSDEDTFQAKFRLGELGSSQLVTITTYYTKKLVNWKFAFKDGNSNHIEEYPFPMLRLADLYLMYAEALNESEERPTADVYRYIDLVRERAGLKGVRESWQEFTLDPTKPESKAGMREIIQQERNIELCFEGARFWDLRRWKLAATELNKNITGWDRTQDKDHPELFYTENTFFAQRFIAPRDYFWPIKESNLLVNPNLVQNPGW